MRSNVKKTLAIVLVLTVILSVAMPAFAAGRWYRLRPGQTLTMNLRYTKSYRPSVKTNVKLLEQNYSHIYLFKRGGYLYRATHSNGVWGYYWVTITQTQNYRWRSVYKRICTNKHWISEFFNVNLAQGVYKVVIKFKGVAYPTYLRTRYGYTPYGWSVYPEVRYC